MINGSCNRSFNKIRYDMLVYLNELRWLLYVTSAVPPMNEEFPPIISIEDDDDDDGEDPRGMVFENTI